MRDLRYEEFERTGRFRTSVLENENSYKLVVEDESGDWRMYEFNDPGYSEHQYLVYHRHDEGWVSQLTLFDECSRCRVQAPEAMKGFKTLIQWKG